jgi:hypothetical protein
LDPDRAPFVFEAFSRVADGHSVRSVSRWIVSLPDDVREGRVLPFQRVRLMLRRPVYVARPHRGEGPILERPICHWPALVPDEMFQRVQERIAEHGRMPRQATGRYLLSGLLRCPSCGWRMCGHQRTGHGPRYRCDGRTGGLTAPDPGCTTTVLAAPADAAVLAQVTHLVATLTDASSTMQVALLQEWRKLQDPNDQAGLDHQINLLERQTDKAKGTLTRVAVLFANGEIDKLGYELARDQARGEYDAAVAELTRLRAQVTSTPKLPPLQTVLADAGGWHAAITGADVEQKRGVLGLLVERVIPVRVRLGQWGAEVVWTPMGAALYAAAEEIMPREPAA